MSAIHNNIFPFKDDFREERKCVIRDNYPVRLTRNALSLKRNEMTSP